jgi:hypothetical protein
LGVGLTILYIFKYLYERYATGYQSYRGLWSLLPFWEVETTTLYTLNFILTQCKGEIMSWNWLHDDEMEIRCSECNILWKSMVWNDKCVDCKDNEKEGD